MMRLKYQISFLFVNQLFSDYIIPFVMKSYNTLTLINNSIPHAKNSVRFIQINL